MAFRVTNVHTLSHITNNATVLSQLSNVSATPGIDVLISSPSGNVFPGFVASQFQNPEVTFDTTQIKTVLDLTGVTMVDLTANDSILYFEKSTNMGVRATGNTHTTLTMANTALICNQISAGHRTQAVASCRLLNVYDGVAAPVVPSGSGTMPVAGTKTDAEHYLFGGISINGTLLVDGAQDVSINFGQGLFEVGADGQNYTSFFGINTVQPVITITGHNLGWATYGLNGTPLTACVVYLRVISKLGPTTGAISFTGTTGLITVDEASGGGTAAALGTIRLTLDETLVLDTDATAPAA